LLLGIYYLSLSLPSPPPFLSLFSLLILLYGIYLVGFWDVRKGRYHERRVQQCFFFFYVYYGTAFGGLRGKAKVIRVVFTPFFPLFFFLFFFIFLIISFQSLYINDFRAQFVGGGVVKPQYS